MPGRAAAADLDLAPVYATALGQPWVVERAARAHLDWPEASEVLAGALDSLWRSILAPDEPESDAGLPSLHPRQKAWLLLHAGLLRGFNLAAITAWRPSGDSVVDLERLYPGFLAYGEALLAESVRDVDLAPPRGDNRQEVDQVAGAARRLIRLGLERGYGLGFLVDAALDERSSGQPRVTAALLERVEAPVEADDPGLVQVATAWGEGRDRAGRREVLRRLMRTQAARRELEAAISEESRARPLSVPSNMARFSPPYVCTMLAYLLRWWLEIGLRLGWQEAALSPEGAARVFDRPRYPIRHWLSSQAYAWAREHVAEVLTLAADATALRWRLAYLAQEMTAVGWYLARELEAARR